MKKYDFLQLALLWAVLTMCCWGVYGPILGKATGQLGGSRALAMVFIGAGYGLLGVIVGWLLLKSKIVPDKGHWNKAGFLKGGFAGALGVAGNFSLVMALMHYHNPAVVMPLVFGGVQLGNTVFTCLDLKKWPKKGFVVGVVLLIIGVVLALMFRPSGEHTKVHSFSWWFLAWVAGVWLAWGKYGVAVHSSIFAFGKSGIRSMISISLAYVVLALGGGLIAYFMGIEPKATFTKEGSTLGIIAGLITTAGAWGIVFGNRYVKGGPSIVMPLVFAGAPVVNSFFAMWWQKLPWSEVSLLFWLGLVVVAFGGYLVLTNKPDASH
ncbi:MAG: EamA family transporter [Verrucomicrobiota bacterium]